MCFVRSPRRGSCNGQFSSRAKDVPTGSLTAQYIPRHEPLLYASKGRRAPRFFGPTSEVTLWEHPKPRVNDLHPTQKPVALLERAIRNSSRRGEVVLDLFAGSGSTLIAAETTGRRCFALELDPRYCDVIRRRYEEFTRWVGAVRSRSRLRAARVTAAVRKPQALELVPAEASARPAFWTGRARSPPGRRTGARMWPRSPPRSTCP